MSLNFDHVILVTERTMSVTVLQMSAIFQLSDEINTIHVDHNYYKYNTVSECSLYYLYNVFDVSINITTESE